MQNCQPANCKLQIAEIEKSAIDIISDLQMAIAEIIYDKERLQRKITELQNLCPGGAK